ncbi:hypothetical protein HZH66_015490 [Vespula vulgaris]|uniref:Uncharacterized protein n=1 Tax=Vespula vulgaris TaxID=7454 RepID=A0A834IWK5_VESVU|nr:hypothetical protein HZH66_015490 [Vespula vulgaris]
MIRIQKNDYFILITTDWVSDLFAVGIRTEGSSDHQIDGNNLAFFMFCNVLLQHIIAFYLYIIFLISPSAVRFLLYSLNVANETKLVLPVSLDDILKNQKNYHWAFFFECAFIFIISTIGIAHYSMFVLIVQHACALFNIVASRIEDGFKSNPLNLNDANHSIFAQECQIPFYSFSLKTQKMLPFMIMKSMMPCNLSMRGVIVLSNLHFAALMRMSFSYARIFYNSL